MITTEICATEVAVRQDLYSIHRSLALDHYWDWAWAASFQRFSVKPAEQLVSLGVLAFVNSLFDW